MGCFSYLCKVCGRPINSSSFRGEGVKLFLLQKGEVLEEMQGDYNSYGSVFDYEWRNDWNDIIDLHFNKNSSDGIAAIHTSCWNGDIPKEQSEDDPEQGWGKRKEAKSKKSFHKFYKTIENDTLP